MKNGLKRSSSAPLINQLVAAEASQSREAAVSGASRQRGGGGAGYGGAGGVVPAAAASRWRRWSTSTSLSPVSPGSPISSQVGLGTMMYNKCINAFLIYREQAGLDSTDCEWKKQATWSYEKFKQKATFTEACV